MAGEALGAGQVSIKRSAVSQERRRETIQEMSDGRVISMTVSVVERCFCWLSLRVCLTLDSPITEHLLTTISQIFLY